MLSGFAMCLIEAEIFYTTPFCITSQVLVFQGQLALNKLVISRSPTREYISGCEPIGKIVLDYISWNKGCFINPKTTDLQFIECAGLNNSIYLISFCQHFCRGHPSCAFRCLNHHRRWTHLYKRTELSPKCPSVKSWDVKYLWQFGCVIVFN